MTNPIPLVDLGAQHAQVKDEVAAGWEAVLARTAFVNGPAVAAFEQEFAQFTGAAHVVGVANGTDAIELALRALGVGPGDEAIVPANTFIATAEAVARTGATPVLVDCTDDTALLDPAKVAAAVTPRTKVAVPVHLYGQTAEVELIRAALPESVTIVEDAAQSQGARRNGQGAGTLGRIAATSFYPGKNLGAYGDAGAVLTNDAELADAVRLLREHGSPSKYVHTVLGFNSRLDTLQAVVLSAKLKRLAGWNAERRRAAERYDTLLKGIDGVGTPTVAPGNEPVWHLYVVRVADRDAVLAKLHEAKIGAGIHYPVPVHLTGAFAGLGNGRGSFPVAEKMADEILSLPLYAEITEEQQNRVVEVLAAAVAQVTLAAGVRVHPQGLCESADVGDGTRVWAFAHVLAGAVVGRDCNICDCAFVEDGATLGDRVTVKNGTLVFRGVTCEDEVFLGPNVLFTNDLRPRAANRLGPEALVPTLVRRGASLGAGVVVVCGTEIGEYAFAAAGAVVTKDVAAHSFVAGNPAVHKGWVCRCGARLDADLRCVECGEAYTLDETTGKLRTASE